MSANPAKAAQLAMTIRLRGEVCEFCGEKAKPRAGFGKLRYPHQCPHGEWCARGKRLLGNHANWPTCQACLPFRRAWLVSHSETPPPKLDKTALTD